MHYQDLLTHGISNFAIAWAKIRPRLEPKVQAQVNKRLYAALKPSVEERMKVLEEVYTTEFLDGLTPADRLYCPPVDAFRLVPELESILEAPKDTVIGTDAFKGFVKDFPRWIREYHDGIKASCRAPHFRSTTP